MSNQRPIGEYCGREHLYGLIKRCDETPYSRNQDLFRKRDKALVATLFLTGAFVEEVLGLTRENFNFEDSEAQARDAFVVKKMKLFRHKRSKDVFRTFPIFNNDPLVEYLREWLSVAEGRLFPMNRQRVWQLIHRFQKRKKYQDIKPMWFRTQRMLYLAQELGWSNFHIQQYFKMQRLPAISGGWESWRNLLYIHEESHTQESIEELKFPNDVLGRLPTEVIKTIRGIMFNYHNDYTRFCFGGMRTALIDAIRIRFIKDKKREKLLDAEGNEYSLPKLIELSKQAGYVSRNMANYLRKRVKVFGDISLHDYMPDLQREEVPEIFTQLRMALARMYPKEESR